MITAIVLYDLPETIGLAECRAHFARIAPEFLGVPGFVRKQFICRRDGKEAGGAYLWESQAAAEAFYAGPWGAGIRARYGCEPRISYCETVALADMERGMAGGWTDTRRRNDGPALPTAASPAAALTGPCPPIFPPRPAAPRPAAGRARSSRARVRAAPAPPARARPAGSVGGS